MSCLFAFSSVQITFHIPLSSICLLFTHYFPVLYDHVSDHWLFRNCLCVCLCVRAMCRRKKKHSLQNQQNNRRKAADLRNEQLWGGRERASRLKPVEMCSCGQHLRSKRYLSIASCTCNIHVYMWSVGRSVVSAFIMLLLCFFFGKLVYETQTNE